MAIFKIAKDAGDLIEPKVIDSPKPDWTAKKIGNWKGALVWEVLFKDKVVGNGFGKDAEEAIQMVRNSNQI